MLERLGVCDGETNITYLLLFYINIYDNLNVIKYYILEINKLWGELWYAE